MSEKKFSYRIGDIDEIIDEQKSQFIALRKIFWNNNEEAKLDLRKYYVNADGEETMAKGVSLFSEDGADQLTQCLLKHGYGDAHEIASIIAENRQDIIDAINEGKTEEDSGYFDPRRLLDDND